MITLNISKDVDIGISVEQVDTINIVVDSVISGSGGELPYYEGDYEVTPKAVDQTLNTRLKSMHDNVHVLEIPYSEVDNPSGGKTVNIAYVL